MSGVRDFKKVSGSEDVMKLQERLQEFFVPFVQCPLIDGTLLTGVQLSTAPKSVEHKLNRAPLGYIITRKNANENVWESSQALPARFLTLTATGAVTVDIWIF